MDVLKASDDHRATCKVCFPSSTLDRELKVVSLKFRILTSSRFKEVLSLQQLDVIQGKESRARKTVYDKSKNQSVDTYNASAIQ